MAWSGWCENSTGKRWLPEDIVLQFELRLSSFRPSFLSFSRGTRLLDFNAVLCFSLQQELNSRPFANRSDSPPIELYGELAINLSIYLTVHIFHVSFLLLSQYKPLSYDNTLQWRQEPISYPELPRPKLQIRVGSGYEINHELRERRTKEKDWVLRRRISYLLLTVRTKRISDE